MSAKQLRLRTWFRRKYAPVCLVMMLAAASAAPANGQQPASAESDDWRGTVRSQAAAGKLDAALKTVEEHLTRNSNDLEAHGWRGRLLAWQGRWPEAEKEYLQVLLQAPDDADILSALADVLVWQGKLQAAIVIIDRARARSPSDQDVLLRRARILTGLGRRREAQAQFRELLLLNPANSQAKAELGSQRSDYKHELRFGNDVDTFNYTDPAQTQSVVLNSRWNPRWSTVLTSSFYQRFGRQAQKFAAGSSFRCSRSDWIGVSGAGANDHGIVPRSEAAFEYGHGFRLQNRLVQGFEASYQQRWLWYAGAHILTIAVAQTYYLPRDWTWSLTVTGARSGFSHTGVEWAPSGNTRLAFPLHTRVSGNLSFAVGSEDYAQVDQVGRFSARTFAGGLRLRLAAKHDVSGYVARQNRSQNRSQTSYGVSYGIHF